jgi:hypothetical protein
MPMENRTNNKKIIQKTAKTQPPASPEQIYIFLYDSSFPVSLYLCSFAAY